MKRARVGANGWGTTAIHAAQVAKHRGFLSPLGYSDTFGRGKNRAGHRRGATGNGRMAAEALVRPVPAC